MARFYVIAAHLIRMKVLSRLEYRGAMLLGWISQFMAYAAAYTAIALIISRFGSLGGWQWSDMALLLSFHLLAYSLGASLSFIQFHDLEDLVRQGSFDAILVKPVGPWTYLAFSGLNIGYAGHIILAIGLMGWALTQVPPGWDFGTGLYFLAALISSSMVVAGFMTMIGASALIWVRARHLYSIFFGFWELARYPLVIFPLPIQVLMITIIPLGFLAYIPVAVALGKDVALLGPFAGVASLLAGPVMVTLSALFWRHCIRSYQGAGG